MFFASVVDKTLFLEHHINTLDGLQPNLQDILTDHLPGLTSIFSWLGIWVWLPKLVVAIIVIVILVVFICYCIQHIHALSNILCKPLERRPKAIPMALLATTTEPSEAAKLVLLTYHSKTH